MQYLALLIGPEPKLTPDERATEMAAYQSFHAKAGPAIRSGDALMSAAEGVRINAKMDQRWFDQPATPDGWKFKKIAPDADAPPKIIRNSGNP